jgi:hypothetical protein
MYLPMGQSVHEVDSADAKRPVPQSLQKCALYSVLNEPGRQLLQTAGNAARNLPGTHAGVGATVGAGVAVAVGAAVVSSSVVGACVGHFVG